MKIAHNRQLAVCIAAILVLIVEGVVNDTETTDLSSGGHCYDFVSGTDGMVLFGTNVPRTAPSANCSSGVVEWSHPKGKRLLYFYRESSTYKVSVRLLLPPTASGNFTARILQGGRELAVTIPEGDALNISSYCGQVSLLLDAAAAEHIMGNSSSNFTIMIHYQLMEIDTEGCPRCSESCMLRCMCMSDHMLIGTVLNSIKDGHSYRHKVRRQYYLRYNGCQDPRYLRTPVCPGKQPKWWQDQEFATDMLTCQGPEFIEVIGKCKLVNDGRYLISGNGWHNPETSLSMHLCCAETPHKPAWLIYQQHLINHSCCRFDR